MVMWSECAADFASDGALRDVYVLEGGIESWDALLRIAQLCSVKFSVGGEPRVLPGRAVEIFAGSEAGAALLLIAWKGIEFAAHFFARTEVELDFVPNVLTGQERLDHLCSFVSTLAVAAGRDVIVSPENLPRSPILRARSSGQVLYEPAKDAA